MELTRLGSEPRGTPYAVMRVCYAAPGLVQASACLVAVRSARGAVPPPPARAWSVLTDSQRPTSGREGRKGAFRATYARFAGGPRDTKLSIGCQFDGRAALLALAERAARLG